MFYIKKTPKFLACYAIIFICVFLFFYFNGININMTYEHDLFYIQEQPAVSDIMGIADTADVSVIPETINEDKTEKTARAMDMEYDYEYEYYDFSGFNPDEPERVAYYKKQPLREFVLSAVGDLSLASNYNKPYAYSFYEFYDLYGPEYFCENVAQVFHESDFTIANLECALTDNDDPAIRQRKEYCYKGYTEYASVLTAAGIDAVCLANNHAFDYSQEGYDDTIEALDNAGIGYFGNGEVLIREINGIKVGFIGILGEQRASGVKDALEYLDRNGAEIKIVSFHWGNNSETITNGSQIAAGRYAIDCGADLVIGHHPHVLQGVEEYNGKYIAYSIGNFIFDGSVITDIENRTSIIFRHKFVMQGPHIIENSIELIPILVTSNMSRNNFKPIIAEDAQKEDILNKIEKRSEPLKFCKDS